MIRPLDQVGSFNAEPSIPELLFRQRKEIGEEAYHVGTAVWVADNLDKYKPRPYPALVEPVRVYLEGRIFADRQRDVDLSRRLGTWVYTVMNLRTQNDADRTLLLWCKAKLEAVGLTLKVEQIEKAIAAFDALKAPHELFHRAINTQGRDANDKMREARQ